MTFNDTINRRSLHDELLDRLRSVIVDGELEPGAKVPERELCERYGVSRTPMREALKVLAAEGWVTLMPNRGAMVSALTLEELEETFPVMGVLEALSGEMACANITDDEITAIQMLHEAMANHYQKRDLVRYFQRNQQIHEAILEAARNPTLSKIYRELAGRVRRARYVANMSEQRWVQAVREHEQILDALTHRDGPRLARILKRHLANKFETLRGSLCDQA